MLGLSTLELEESPWLESRLVVQHSFSGEQGMLMEYNSKAVLTFVQILPTACHQHRLRGHMLYQAALPTEARGGS